jgi:hypothetical protein
LEDTTKATFEYLSAAGGKYSQAVIDRSEEMATLGMRANTTHLNENLPPSLTILTSFAVPVE